MVNEVITASDIYWLTRMDYAHGFAIGCAVATGLAALCLLIAWLVNSTEAVTKDDKQSVAKQRHWFYFVTPVFILCTAAACLVPTTKEAIAIKVIPAIANNEDLQGLGKDVVDTAREWLNELRPSKQDGK